MNTNTTDQNPTFAALLQAAVNEPGQLHAGYSAFWNYSVGNMLLALSQCHERGITPGPIATYNRWRELGRHVVKGQKAITLCQPVTCKRTIEPEGEYGSEPTEVAFTRFTFRRSWFVLSQTEGAAYEPQPLPDWSRGRALQALDIAEAQFQHLDGNCQGYAVGRSIAVSPLAAFPLKTAFHECAHVLLGHTTEGELSDDERTPRNLREVEAEAVAMICCAALGLPGVEFSRGYIQSWWGKGNPIPEASARAVLKVADQILKAGRTTAAAEAV